MLGYRAESRRKVMRERVGFAIRRLETSLCQPSKQSVPFSILERQRQRKDGDGIQLLSA